MERGRGIEAFAQALRFNQTGLEAIVAVRQEFIERRDRLQPRGSGVTGWVHISRFRLLELSQKNILARFGLLGLRSGDKALNSPLKTINALHSQNRTKKSMSRFGGCPTLVGRLGFREGRTQFPQAASERPHGSSKPFTDRLGGGAHLDCDLFPREVFFNPQT